MFLTGRVVSAKERKTQKGQREVVLQVAEETAGMLTVKAYPSDGASFNFGDVIAGEVRSCVSWAFKDKGYFSLILKGGYSVQPGAFPHNAG